MNRININYPAMTKSQAQATWRRRREILQYDNASHISALDQLFAALDRMTDSELEKYLEGRRRRRQAKASGRGTNGRADSPKDLPKANIGTLHTAPTGSNGHVDQYSKATRDKALRVCYAKQSEGKHVDYGMVAEAIHRGQWRD